MDTDLETLEFWCQHTSLMDSPKTKTRVWSATVLGEVRKKKPIVMWKRDRERIMVFPFMSPILRLTRRILNSYVCMKLCILTLLVCS